jgi:hypothetical protein
MITKIIMAKTQNSLFEEVKILVGIINKMSSL